MAKYIKQEMPDIRNTGESYYRMAVRGNIDGNRLLQLLCSHGNGLTEGVAAHVLSTLARKIARAMADGNTVTVPGIDTFKAQLGVASCNGGNGGTEINARSIGVAYRASRQLVAETNWNCTLERGGESRLNRPKGTPEEGLALAKAYMAAPERPFMRIADYSRLTGMAHMSAAFELRLLRDDPASGITTDGKGPAMVYVLKA